MSGPSHFRRPVDRAFDALAGYWHAPAPAERLAVLRVLTGLFAFVYVTVRIVYFASYEKLSPQQFEPIGVVSLLEAPLPASATWAVAIVMVLSGALFTLGFHYRVSGPLFGATLLWVFTYRSSWGMIFHTENLLCMHVLALSLAPGAADAYSLDARRSGESPAAHGRYGWPIRLMCTITVLAYVIAGVTKLRSSGAGWFTSDLLQNYVAYDAIRKAELGSVHSSLGSYLSASHPGIFKPAAAFSLLMELFAPLALVNRKLAAYWVASAVLFHAGVLAVMAILFPYPLFVIGFASFFRVERLADRVVTRFRRAEASPTPVVAPTGD